VTENNMVIPHGDEIHKNVAGEFASVSEKTDTVGTDIVLIEDSADSNNKKKVLLSNLLADIPNHASNHLPSGSDALATGVPSNVGVANAEGSAEAFARQDHVHDHADQAGGSLHANAIAAGASGFMTGADKTKLDNIEPLAEVNNISDPDAATLTGGGNADALHVHSVASAIKEFFHPANPSTNFGNYRVRAVATNGNHNFNLMVPSDFASLVSVEMIFISGGTFVAQNIDLSSEYGAIGEQNDNHAETDVAFTTSGTADETGSYSLASVLSSLAAGDFVGINIDHQGIGTSLNYLGIRLIYNT